MRSWKPVHWKKHNFLNVENEKLSYYLQFSFDLDKIRSGRCAQKVECLRVSWKSAERKSLYLQASTIRTFHIYCSIRVKFDIRSVIILLGIFCENFPWEGHTFLAVIDEITFTHVPYDLESKERLGKACVPRDGAHNSQSSLFIKTRYNEMM